MSFITYVNLPVYLWQKAKEKERSLFKHPINMVYAQLSYLMAWLGLDMLVYYESQVYWVRL